jgi:hypothetical protein
MSRSTRRSCWRKSRRPGRPGLSEVDRQVKGGAQERATANAHVPGAIAVAMWDLPFER